MQNRRTFLKRAVWGSGLLLAGGFPFESLSAPAIHKLTILHTNDVHSRLEPFPMDGSKYEGQGGAAARAALIEKIRQEEEHVLLLDAGDIFQGTPYFNLYKGEPEMKVMSAMKYDAATMGNHDFDAGVEGFVAQLPHANFPILVANYECFDTLLENKIQSYKIFQKGALRIGVFGLGIQLKGLVPDEAFGKVKYLEPIRIAREISEKLKKKEKCDFVICLSHLGYEYANTKVSDVVIARETKYIDLILGGHTHTFLEEPTVIQNQEKKPVLVNQVGWAGLRLGRLDFVFDRAKKGNLLSAHSVILRKETIG